MFGQLSRAGLAVPFLERLGRAILTFVVCAGAPAAAAHDVASWRGIVHDKFTPPAGSDVPALAWELTDPLASADPELRDDIAYATLTSWIYQQKIVDAALLRTLTSRLLANLTAA